MQIRKHAGNLISAQIWFRMKDCLRGGGRGVGVWWHYTKLPNYAQCLFSQWASNMLQLEMHPGWRLEVNSTAKGCVILFPPRDAEWKLQLMGVLCPHQHKNKSACVYALLLLPPLNQISKCFILLLKSQKMGSFVTVHKLRGLHCAVTDNQGMAKLKLIKHVSQWGRLFC